MVEKMIHPANEEAIGNRLYANKNGNGDIASGDGYKYRGRGLIQVTGKSNYHNIANKIKEFYGENLDLLEHPDVVADRPVESAISYWASRSVPKVVMDNHKPKKVYLSGLGALVDYDLEKGMAVEQINKDVTRAINGGYNALWERKNKLDKLLKMTFFKLCKEVEKGVKKVSLVWLVNFIKSV